ncbi:ATPase [Porphyrobacter sp. GA68]|uniref:ATPase n=1 Tax=Porphyrobacter sp. GA68 TaxID=2883480 RepID=UPI001D196D4F|nr:ATPase [Porphyrobacter sp. GA68]
MQLALPLLDAGEDASRIVLGAANTAAVQALAKPSAWPFGTAILAGPPRSGKSLLGRWFAARHPAAEVVDEAEHVPEVDLFHIWNRVQERGHPLLLITGDEVWQVSLADLRSRLASALHLAVELPDDAMLASLIDLHAERRRLVLGEGAATYLAARIRRSYAAAETVVAEIDRLSLQRKLAPTRAIWREALEALEQPEQSRLC